MQQFKWKKKKKKTANVYGVGMERTQINNL